MPDHYFGGGTTDSVMHPVVMVAMMSAIGLMLVLLRNWVTTRHDVAATRDAVRVAQAIRRASRDDA